MIDAAFDLPHEHEDSGPTVTLENMPSTPQKQDSPRKRNSVDSKSDATSKRNKRLDSIVRKIKHQLNTLAAAFSAMNDTLNFSISDIYFNLSKSLIFDCLSDNWTQFIDWALFIPCHFWLLIAISVTYRKTDRRTWFWLDSSLSRSPTEITTISFQLSSIKRWSYIPSMFTTPATCKN